MDRRRDQQRTMEITVKPVSPHPLTKLQVVLMSLSMANARQLWRRSTSCRNPSDVPLRRWIQVGHGRRRPRTRRRHRTPGAKRCSRSRRIPGIALEKLVDTCQSATAMDNLCMVHHCSGNRKYPLAPTTLHTPVAILCPRSPAVSEKKNPASLPTANPGFVCASPCFGAAVVYSSCGSVVKLILSDRGLNAGDVPEGLCMN